MTLADLMSFSAQQALDFFGPLRGRTTTFLVEGRQENLVLARTMMALLSRGTGCTILDLDAFYSSNANMVLSMLGGESARSTLVHVPQPGVEVEGELSRLFESSHDVIVVDSLNSLYHLVSQEDGTSGIRKLTFAVAGLSYLAKTNDKAVMLTMYRREGFGHSGTARSISNLSDSTAAVQERDGILAIRIERGTAWPGGLFSTRTP